MKKLLAVIVAAVAVTNVSAQNSVRDREMSFAAVVECGIAYIAGKPKVSSELARRMDVLGERIFVDANIFVLSNKLPGWDEHRLTRFIAIRAAAYAPGGSSHNRVLEQVWQCQQFLPREYKI